MAKIAGDVLDPSTRTRREPSIKAAIRLGKMPLV